MEIKINQCKYNIKEFIKNIICEEFKIDYWEEWLEEQDYNALQKEPNILISVEDKNSLIGICGVKIINKDECYFNSFYIRKDYRNQKIGTKIFDMCMQYVINNKYKKAFLTVDPKFLIAIKFYEKNGFIFDYFDKKRQELYYYKYLTK